MIRVKSRQCFFFFSCYDYINETGILTLFVCVYYQPFRRAPESNTYFVCPSSTLFRSVHTETVCQYVVTGFASI